MFTCPFHISFVDFIATCVIYFDHTGKHPSSLLLNVQHHSDTVTGVDRALNHTSFTASSEHIGTPSDLASLGSWVPYASRQDVFVSRSDWCMFEAYSNPDKAWSR